MRNLICNSIALALFVCAALNARPVAAIEDLNIYRGSEIPPEVEAMYIKGISYLVSNQSGLDKQAQNRRSGPAIAALTMLAILAHGDDPAHGPYAKKLTGCLDVILEAQNRKNGYIGMSMYNHGFATLALAEAYGAMQDERIGPALKNAIDLILSSQKRNPFNAWRYNPDGKDADSTVSGACAVALLAGRNAGFGVPDSAVEQMLRFYALCFDGKNGFAYVPGSGARGSSPTTAIGLAVYAYARVKQTRAFVVSFRSLCSSLQEGMNASQWGHYFYSLYYLSQALFQADVQRWEVWNRKNIEHLRRTQQADGSWTGDSNGPIFATATALLSLALNYRYLPIYER